MNTCVKWVLGGALLGVVVLVLTSCGLKLVPVPFPVPCTPTPTVAPEPTAEPAPTDPPLLPTPTPEPTPTPVVGEICPTYLLDRVDVKFYRTADPRTGFTLPNPPRSGDKIIWNVTPKSAKPYCPDNRNMCELKKECQKELVGYPHVTFTLVGQWQDAVIDHSSNEPFIVFSESDVSEHGKYIVTACTQWQSHCSSTETEVLRGPR